MNNRLKKFEAFHTTRSDRERVLILIVSLVCIHFVFSKLFLMTITNSLVSIEREVEQYHIKVDQARTKESVLQRKIQSLAKSNIPEQIQALNKKVSQLDEEINKRSTAISSPEKTISFIHDIFYSYDQIYLKSIKNSVPKREDSMSNLVGRDIFLHEVVLSFEGTFDAIEGFMRDFEIKQPSVPAYSLHFISKEYPKIEARIVYHLYSFKKEIIGV